MRQEARAFAIPMACGLVGILIAIMLQMFDSAGIIIDEYLTGTLVLREVQAFIIIIWIVIGIVFAAVKN